jgi:hypothetical protein
MRVATPLLCLILAACAGGKLPGEQPAPDAANPSAAAAANAPDASNPPATRTNQAARAASPPPQPQPQATPEPDRLIQARVDCWMKVEHQKGIRDIDRRIVFVDKCVADAMKEPVR